MPYSFCIQMMVLERKKMRVLMIDHWSKDNMYTLELCSKLGNIVELDLLTVDNSMLTGNVNYLYFKKLLGYGHKKNYKIYIKYFKTLFEHFRLVISKKYDCVHVQTYKTPIEILLYIMFKPLIKKLVLTVHNVLPHEQKKFDYLLYNTIYKKADKLIVHNEQTRTQLSELFNIDNNEIYVVPHGIYSSHISNIHDIKEEDGESKSNLLFFGLIRPYKGLDVLINALELLPEKYRNKVSVKIVGNNVDNIDFKQQLKSKNLSTFVDLVDQFVPESEVGDYFNWADAVILPYKKISGSGALLLSYTFNKIVITSDLPAFIEETDNGKTGLIFKNNNPSDLCEKIIQFLESNKSERKIFSENIKNIIKEKYNWGNSALLTVNIYKD